MGCSCDRIERARPAGRLQSCVVDEGVDRFTIRLGVTRIVGLGTGAKKARCPRRRRRRIIPNSRGRRHPLQLVLGAWLGQPRCRWRLFNQSPSGVNNSWPECKDLIFFWVVGSLCPVRKLVGTRVFTRTPHSHTLEGAGIVDAGMAHNQNGYHNLSSISVCGCLLYNSRNPLVSIFVKVPQVTRG